MRINWGTRIAILYLGFMILMICLVTASSRQHFDLVSDNYYKDEIAYQEVIDAGKNQATLGAPITIHANEMTVVIDLPAEIRDKAYSGTIHFYSPVDASFDRQFNISGAGDLIISRSKLLHKQYKVKMNVNAGGKKYYQECDLNLYSK